MKHEGLKIPVCDYWASSLRACETQLVGSGCSFAHESAFARGTPRGIQEREMQISNYQ